MLFGKVHTHRQIAGLKISQTKQGINGNFYYFLRRIPGDFLDFHAALRRSHHHRAALRAVVGDSKVDFFHNRNGLIDQNLSNFEALNLHSQNLRRQLFSFLGRLCQPDATCLSASADQNLRFYNHPAAEFFGDLLGLGGNPGNAPPWDRHAVSRKNRLGLVLMKFHPGSLIRLDG